jgi:hypothetical protein
MSAAYKGVRVRTRASIAISHRQSACETSGITSEIDSICRLRVRRVKSKLSLTRFLHLTYSRGFTAD